MALPFQPYSKELQLSGKRLKLTRKQRSEASPAVRREVHARSGGVCEKCDRARASELAHIERRWLSECKPTAKDYAHLCKPCHTWCDASRAGRQWLTDFKKKLLEVESA